METNVLYLNLVSFQNLQRNLSLCCICIYFHFNTAKAIHSILFAYFKCLYNINYKMLYPQSSPTIANVNPLIFICQYYWKMTA